MLSRVLGSASIIAARESSQPIAAFGWELRIATASEAAEGSRVHLNSSAGGLPSRAAACSKLGSAVRGLPSQKPPDSTPPAERPVAAARALARVVGVRGAWQ